MRNNKLQSLNASLFKSAKLKISDDTATIQEASVPIKGKGRINGSDYSYTGDISICKGVGEIGVGWGPFNAGMSKEFTYDCDWSATITYDNITVDRHGSF